MPRVSQQFRDQQVSRIVSAAERCFADTGFQGTSMDQIIAAATMSSSTVYRYFPDGKQAIVRAVSGMRMEHLLAALQAIAGAEHVLPPAPAFIAVLEGLGAQPRRAESDVTSFDVSARLAVNAWGERHRDPELQVFMRANYQAIAKATVLLVRRWQAESMIDTSLSAEDAAQLIQHLAFGVIAEQAIVGRTDVAAAARRLGELLNPRE